MALLSCTAKCTESWGHTDCWYTTVWWCDEAAAADEFRWRASPADSGDSTNSDWQDWDKHGIGKPRKLIGVLIF